MIFDQEGGRQDGLDRNANQLQIISQQTDCAIIALVDS